MLHRTGPEKNALDDTAEGEVELSKDQIIHSTWAALTFSIIGVGMLLPGWLMVFLSESLTCSTPIEHFMRVGALLTVTYCASTLIIVRLMFSKR